MASRWYIRYPTDFYALGPIDFGEDVDESEVRTYIRKHTKVSRLPRGFECWPASTDEKQQSLYII